MRSCGEVNPADPITRPIDEPDKMKLGLTRNTRELRAKLRRGRCPKAGLITKPIDEPHKTREIQYLETSQPRVKGERLTLDVD